MRENRNGRGTVDKSWDLQLRALLSETENKFQQREYRDRSVGISFGYNLFIPESCEFSQEYPLILFIHDAGVIGGKVTATLEQGYGALVWATEEDQEKHPCFILAPEYPENILRRMEGVTDYVSATLNLLNELITTYSIDIDRLYITGQSMGCMAALYLDAVYPDLFAASLYVDGQWPIDILTPLEQHPFFYFTAEGDERASSGKAEVMAMFDADGVPYGSAVLNAKDSDIESEIARVITKNYRSNFITWTRGSVLPEGVDLSVPAAEHMYAFDHAYRISAVRDWLFRQTNTDVFSD